MNTPASSMIPMLSTMFVDPSFERPVRSDSSISAWHVASSSWHPTPKKSEIASVSHFDGMNSISASSFMYLRKASALYGIEIYHLSMKTSNCSKLTMFHRYLRPT